MAPEGDRIHAELVGRHVDDPFEHRGRLGASRAAVGTDRRAVGQDGVDLEAHLRDPIHALRHHARRPLRERAAEQGVSAGVGEDAGAQSRRSCRRASTRARRTAPGNDRASCRRGSPSATRPIARAVAGRAAAFMTMLASGDQCFAPKPPPTWGAIRRISPISIPNIAAAAMRAMCGIWQPTYTVSLWPRPSSPGSTATAPPSIGTTASRWFSNRPRTTTSAPASTSSPGGSRRPSTAFVPSSSKSNGASGRKRRVEIIHGRERVVVDDHHLGRVNRLCACLGDDGDDDVADEAHLVLRERRTGTGGLHVHEEVVVGCVEVGAGVHANDARHVTRGAEIDRLDPRVSDRRPHEHHLEHPCDLQVVDEGPLATQQRRVFDATHGQAEERPRTVGDHPGVATGSGSGRGAHRALRATSSSARRTSTRARWRRYSSLAFRSVGGSVPSSATSAAPSARSAVAETILDGRGADGRGAHVHERHSRRVAADRSHADDRPVLGPPVELLEGEAHASALRDAHLGDHLVGCECALEEAFEEVIRRDLALAVAALRHDRAPQREHARRQVGRRIGVRERSTQRAAVAHLRDRPTSPAATASSGTCSRSTSLCSRSWCRVSPPIATCVPTSRTYASSRSPPTSTITDGVGQPKLHQRQERVPAREQLGVVAVLIEQTRWRSSSESART